MYSIKTTKMYVRPASRTVRSLLSLQHNRSLTAVTRKLALGGIFPPIPIIFDDQEDIKLSALQKNVEKLNKIPFKGLVVHGSNGEYTYLTTEEKVEVVKKVRSWTPADKLIIVGSGCESTRDTIRLSRALADVGADAVLVVTPCYYKSGMTVEALNNHFTKVADDCPVPVILYNVPSFTSIDLPAESVVTLAKHPNIIALKESSGNVVKIGSIVHQTKNEDFQVLAGSASFILQSAVVGSVGAVCALANVLGEEVCHLHDLCKSGDITAASSLQQKLIGPNASVTSRFGVPGLKFAMEQFGYFGGKPRSPLLPLSEEKQGLLLNDFKQDGYLK